MKKIPNELECPIDNIIIDCISEPLSIVFKRLNFTPNGITTLSLIFGVLSIWSLCKSSAAAAVIFMFLSYAMDCVDGYYARKYNMVTTGGDYYDHVKDILVFVVYIAILYKRNSHKLDKKQWYIVLAVLIFFITTSVLYFACQERYYDNAQDIPSLGWLRKLIPSKDAAKKCLRVLRYFGMGTFILMLLAFTVWIERR